MRNEKETLVLPAIKNHKIIKRIILWYSAIKKFNYKYLS